MFYVKPCDNHKEKYKMRKELTPVTTKTQKNSKIETKVAEAKKNRKLQINTKQ